MSTGRNLVILVGNLGADPELRSTNSGTSVLRLRIATTESYLDRNKARQTKTEWHAATIWGARAEALHAILTKGTRVYVEGSLTTSSYDDKEGIKRYKTEINVKELILCGGGQGGGGQSSGGGGGQQRQDSPPPDDFGGGGGFGGEDDIPF
jgi:single-strand DNA-binding protein